MPCICLQPRPVAHGSSGVRNRCLVELVKRSPPLSKQTLKLRAYMCDRMFSKGRCTSELAGGVSGDVLKELSVQAAWKRSTGCRSVPAGIASRSTTAHDDTCDPASEPSSEDAGGAAMKDHRWLGCLLAIMSHVTKQLRFLGAENVRRTKAVALKALMLIQRVRCLPQRSFYCLCNVPGRHDMGAGVSFETPARGWIAEGLVTTQAHVRRRCLDKHALHVVPRKLSHAPTWYHTLSMRL